LTASKAAYRSGFGPLLPSVVHAPYADSFSAGASSHTGVGSFDYLEEVVFKRLVSPRDIAAVVVEPVLGEGGYVVPPTEWVRKLRRLCSAHDMLLVVDEVQSGMGRTGKMWAVQHFDVEPDILLVGKGIASGMPLGAMIARADLMTWEAGAHGSTYGGNPVSCAAALATIDVLEKELVANAAQVGGFLLAELRALQRRQPLVTDVRGLGLMIGIELRSPEAAAAVEKACFERGVLVLRAGEAAIRMSPPLLITSEQASVGVRLFEDACAEAAASSAPPRKSP
jgi:4-aminobutyrate aminotransferase